MLLNAKTMELIALGFFSPPPLLHGFGLSYSGSQLLLGIFKSNLLIREYSHSSHLHSSKLGITSFQAREVLAAEHMKSDKYMHEVIHIGEVGRLRGIAVKLVKYIDAFEEEVRKRNSGNSITDAFDSKESEAILPRNKYF